jgi:hypothetical protein
MSGSAPTVTAARVPWASKNTATIPLCTATLLANAPYGVRSTALTDCGLDGSAMLTMSMVPAKTLVMNECFVGGSYAAISDPGNSSGLSSAPVNTPDAYVPSHDEVMSFCLSATNALAPASRSPVRSAAGDDARRRRRAGVNEKG